MRCWPSVFVMAHLRITLLLEHVVLALVAIGAQRGARLPI